MLKKITIILIMSFLLVGLRGKVFAQDLSTATSTINGITVNWQYELNESNQIEDLKCTNPIDLTGNITLPSTLDGKTVISLKEEAFKGANITGLEIPDSIKKIGYNAFKDCEKLEKVTILNEKAEMGWFNTFSEKDSVFENHNENLTIYCYENSTAARYAIANNIKYIYLKQSPE